MKRIILSFLTVASLVAVANCIEAEHDRQAEGACCVDYWGPLPAEEPAKYLEPDTMKALDRGDNLPRMALNPKWVRWKVGFPKCPYTTLDGEHVPKCEGEAWGHVVPYVSEVKGAGEVELDKNEY